MAEVELTIDEQLEKYVDAVKNPLEFFKYVKILDSTSNEIIPYEMWGHLITFIRAVYTHPLVIVLKSKQVGVSWTIAGISTHWCYRTGGNVLTLSSGKDEAADLLAKSRFIYGQLPKFLQQELEHDGTFLLGFKKSHSRILALPSTKDAGIGNTGSLVVCDENEFHDYAKENYAQLKATVDAGAHMVVVSTTDKTRVDSHFKTLWREARAGRNNFKPYFFGWDVVPARTQEWYEKTDRDYYLHWQFLQNYPRTEEEALSPISGRSVFDPELLSRMLERCEEPTEVRQGAINIYLRPRVGVRYIAGVDIAEGGGGAASVLWIEGQEGLQRELCAVIYSRNIRPDVFAYMSVELLKEYFNPMVIGGADAMGNRYLKDMVALGYPVGKIYCSDKKREKFGYQETEYTQQADVLELDKALRAGLRIRYKPAVLELFAYQWKDTKGKTKAEVAEGSLKDIVMAMAKANFGFTKYKTTGAVTVSHFY